LPLLLFWQLGDTDKVISIGPQTFAAKDAPRYVPAEIAIIVCWGVTLLGLMLVYWYCKRQNAKKAVEWAQPGYVVKNNQE
jgi:ACS family allantoate permease-like MFS transporter